MLWYIHSEIKTYFLCFIVISSNVAVLLHFEITKAFLFNETENCYGDHTKLKKNDDGLKQRKRRYRHPVEQKSCCKKAILVYWYFKNAVIKISVFFFKNLKNNISHRSIAEHVILANLNLLTVYNL